MKNLGIINQDLFLEIQYASSPLKHAQMRFLWRKKQSILMLQETHSHHQCIVALTLHKHINKLGYFTNYTAFLKSEIGWQESSKFKIHWNAWCFVQLEVGNFTDFSFPFVVCFSQNQYLGKCALTSICTVGGWPHSDFKIMLSLLLKI